MKLKFIKILLESTIKKMCCFFGFILSVIFLVGCTLPKPINDDFEGKFIYQISSETNSVQDISDSSQYQIVFAKDSMLRIDNFTMLGKQIYIQHIPKKKAYILMKLGDQKFAVQTFVDTMQNIDYVYNYHRGSDFFAGIKGKNIKVTDLELDTTIIMNYHHKISPKYSTAINGMPGLPVKYYLYNNQIWHTYSLIYLEKKPLSINLFGIPSDYKIITLDEFVLLMSDEGDE